MSREYENARELGVHFFREWRNKCGFNQDEVAAAMGITQGQYSRIEGFKMPYTQVHLEAMAEKIGCSPADLLSVNPAKGGRPATLEERIAALPPPERSKLIEILSIYLK